MCRRGSQPFLTINRICIIGAHPYIECSEPDASHGLKHFLTNIRGVIRCFAGYWQIFPQWATGGFPFVLMIDGTSVPCLHPDVSEKNTGQSRQAGYCVGVLPHSPQWSWPKERWSCVKKDHPILCRVFGAATRTPMPHRNKFEIGMAHTYLCLNFEGMHTWLA